MLATATFRPELFAMVAVTGERSALAPYLRWMEAMEGMRGRALWLGEVATDGVALTRASLALGTAEADLARPRDLRLEKRGHLI